MTALAAAVLGLLAATPTKGGLEWPVIPDEQLPKHSLRCAPLSRDSRTVLGVLLQDEKAMLDEAERVLGPAPLQEEGDAAEYEAWRCWQAANGDGTVVVFSKGEVPGGVSVMGREMAYAHRSECARSRKLSRATATRSGIRIGMTRAELVRVVGPPEFRGPNWTWKTCCGVLPEHAGEKDAPRACSIIRTVESKGRVVAFGMSWWFDEDKGD